MSEGEQLLFVLFVVVPIGALYLLGLCWVMSRIFEWMVRK